jgi:pantoate--beta-alanine ligase
MTETALPIARTVRDLRAQIARWRNQNETVGLIPTMGALHAGHISLVSAVKARCDRAVATLFVNPRQFAPGEDFTSYPRDEAADAELLAEAGCDLLYAPEPAAMYPPRHATSVVVSDVAEPLEGEARPHFFIGVATVVTKLLMQALPDVAIFGEKDYQQLLVIRRLALDLDIPVQIVSGPTVREEDGLAMSSRNAYLSPQARTIAGRLNAILKEAVAALEAGAEIMGVLVRVERALFKAGFDGIDYIAVRGAEDFLPIASPIVRRSARLLAAVRLGDVRLIDNMPVAAPEI